jgi:hypothetical protein
MPCEKPIDCFEISSDVDVDLRKKRFSRIYVRKKFTEETNYEVSRSSYGIAGSINRRKNRLYILIDKKEPEDSAKEFFRRLVQLEVMCDEIKVKGVATSRSFHRIKSMARILKSGASYDDDDSSDSD